MNDLCMFIRYLVSKHMFEKILNLDSIIGVSVEKNKINNNDYHIVTGAVGGDGDDSDDKEKEEEAERERQEAIREAEDRRKEKHRKMEEEREKMRQEIRDKVRKYPIT
jgi:septin family protein